jgi:hypothetical protein
MPSVASSITVIGGAKFTMKSMNVSSSTTVPMMMLGGSPTNVAVPPIRECAPYFYNAPPNAGSDLETASKTTGLTVGSPAEVIEKVLSFPSYFGNYRRQLFSLDFGGIPERTVHEQIDLIGNDILPALRRELGPATQAEPDASTRHWSDAPRNTTTQASA